MQRDGLMRRILGGGKNLSAYLRPRSRAIGIVQQLAGNGANKTLELGDCADSEVAKQNTAVIE